MTGVDDFPPVAWGVVEHLFGILWSCSVDAVPMPDMVPHPVGGVQLDWRTDRFVITVELLNDGRVSWFRTEPWSTGAPIELDLTGVAVADIVARVASDRW